MMRVSKAASDAVKAARKGAQDAAIELGELSEMLGYTLKRAQLRIFDDFMRCVAPLQLTPAQFSVLLLLDRNPGRHQTEIASTLGILRPNFVAVLDGLESRHLCARRASTNCWARTTAPHWSRCWGRLRTSFEGRPSCPGRSAVRRNALLIRG